MKVFAVHEVDYDGYQIGRTLRLGVCATWEAANQLLKTYTQPVNYHDGPREFHPHVHREKHYREEIVGYVGPVPTFVFIKEMEVQQ